MKPLDFTKIERVLQEYDLGQEPRDRDYWASRTYEERAQGIEFLRQAAFGYDPATARVQRVLEVAEFPRS